MPLGPGLSVVNAIVKAHTRAMAGGSGSEPYTGYGFRPKVVFIMANFGAQVSWGVDNGTTFKCIYDINGTGLTWEGSYSVELNDGAGNSQVAKVSSFDADGFTLIWTKAGAPSGTGNFVVLAIG